MKIALSFAMMLAAIPVAPTRGQTFEGSLLQSWSDAPRLETPAGFSLAFVSPFPGWIAPRVGYTHRKDGHEYRGFACPSLQPCMEELVEDDMTLHAFDAGIVVRHGITETVDVRAGVAALWVQAKGEIHGRETGQVLDLGSESALGWVVRLGSHWRPPGIRWAALATELRWERTLTGGCATESYVPFCEHQSFLSLSAGIAAP